jgi:uncharacterized membrane protein
LPLLGGNAANQRDNLHFTLKDFSMAELTKLAHLIAAIVWMGGMTFMLFALRPAIMAQMEPPQRLALMGAVWQRFFAVVAGAVVVLFATGTSMYTALFRATRLATGQGGVPLGWNLMLIFGLAMMLIFGHIYFAGFRKFKRAVAAAAWPVAAQAAAQIHVLVVTNFVLGWLAIAAVRLVG